MKVRKMKLTVTRRDCSTANYVEMCLISKYTYQFRSGVRFKDDSTIVSRVGDSSSVTKDGNYFLPWHVAALLGRNGEGNSWIEDNADNPEKVLNTLTDLKVKYEILEWSDFLKILNSREYWEKIEKEWLEIKRKYDNKN
jgi:hypothetical protein